MSAPSLPAYARPPVVETILSAQFDPLDTVTSAHLGAWWRQLGPDWPTVADAPAVEPQFEHFNDLGQWRELGLRLRLGRAIEARLQIRNARNDRMIQVQRDRFLYNWLGTQGGVYPRYESIREEFLGHFAGFQRFLAAENLGQIRLNQWEITYLNHIPRGDVWSTPQDWCFFRPLGESVDVDSPTRLESFGGQWRYVIQDGAEPKGRLHVAWKHAMTKQPGAEKEVIVLDLTARGPVDPDGGATSLVEGFDRGRRSIVLTFRKLMSDRANEHWGLQNACD